MKIKRQVVQKGRVQDLKKKFKSTAKRSSIKISKGKTKTELSIDIGSGGRILRSQTTRILTKPVVHQTRVQKELTKPNSSNRGNSVTKKNNLKEVEEGPGYLSPISESDSQESDHDDLYVPNCTDSPPDLKKKKRLLSNFTKKHETYKETILQRDESPEEMEPDNTGKDNVQKRRLRKRCLSKCSQFSIESNLSQPDKDLVYGNILRQNFINPNSKISKKAANVRMSNISQESNSNEPTNGTESIVCITIGSDSDDSEIGLNLNQATTKLRSLDESSGVSPTIISGKSGVIESNSNEPTNGTESIVCITIGSDSDDSEIGLNLNQATTKLRSLDESSGVSPTIISGKSGVSSSTLLTPSSSNLTSPSINSFD